jgi:hypothetical protein
MLLSFDGLGCFGVGWFRSRTRLGGSLALFALALQLLVSFGHVHADELTSKPLGIATVWHVGESQAPAGDADTDHHDDYCDICATLHALASAQIATPPPLPIPYAFAQVAPQIDEGVEVAEARRASFQSRAPPVA